MQKFTTIDAHVAGETVRLIVGGGPSVSGRTMAEKMAWLRKHGEPLRRCLMLEPRGHGGMHGALLTEPVSPRAHAGLLSMHAAGFPHLSAEGVIAAVMIALENKLIEGESERLILDTPAGEVRAHPQLSAAGRVERVAMTNVPAFVFSAGLSIQFRKRAVRVDIAFGGEFYAIVDSESVGIPVDTSHAQRLIAAAAEIQEAVETAKDVDGVIFTAPSRGAADLRSATVLDGGLLRRSPGGTGTCALLAVLDAMGLVAADQTFTHEGVIGTTLTARALSRHTTEEIPHVVAEVAGSAWTTGRHQFEMDAGDRLQTFEVV